MRALIVDWLMLLLCLAPLAALLVMSLGLVVLKRRSGLSPRLARLAAPPFYLVSLPIATLIAGADMLGLYSLVILDGLLSPYGFSWNVVFERFFNVVLAALIAVLFSPYVSFELFGLMIVTLPIGFWAAAFASGYLFWRTVWHEGRHQASSRVTRQRRRGVLLLVFFAWAFIYLVTFIGGLMAPWGPSSVG
jgi:hypothetical protein